jgi:periplasmic copper chaperone A
MPRTILTAALLLIATLSSALAQTAPIQADHAWARATPGGAKAAAVYLTLVNMGTADDRLVSVSTTVAGKATLHRTTTQDGVTRMRPVASLDVKPGTPVELKPGGYHIMLTDLKGPLVAGQSFSLSLTFEKAGMIDVTAEVEKAGAMKPDSMPGMKM